MGVPIERVSVNQPSTDKRFVLEELQSLLTALGTHGYRVLGPRARDGAIVYDALHTVDELPVGWQDDQTAGRYRLQKGDSAELFGYTVGPQSWKKFLLPPSLELWQAQRQDRQLKFRLSEAPPAPMAFFGVRACELHAIAIQDRVFLEGPYADADYARRRANVFIVAVQCGRAGGTCFCVSMHTGPKADAGFDLALTEVPADGRQYFVVETGSERGMQMLAAIPHREASPAETARAEAIVANTAQHMGRTMDSGGIKELLYRNAEHPHWETVAQRCLACTNCTLVCPTCFCTAVEDTTDLTGAQAGRKRMWDSCFTSGFSYIHGGSVRSSVRSRYRQWLTHKLASWIDQFGSSGCVGCGRCITWCPAAIDITEEVRALRTIPSKEKHNAET